MLRIIALSISDQMKGTTKMHVPDRISIIKTFIVELNPKEKVKGNKQPSFISQ
jgi:hypothetical protein